MAALRWFGPLARWLHLSGASPSGQRQPASGGQPDGGRPDGGRPDGPAGSSAERTVPFAGAGVPAAGTAGPMAGISGPGNPAGAPAGGSGAEGSFEGSADATGPLVGISGQPGIPAGRPAARRDRPGRRRFGTAMRRLMVTPTFAAGLGVVVAASLAANMTKTVLHFSSPLPGGQCQIGACHPQPSHGGTLASARPGVPIVVPRKRAGAGAGAARPGTSRRMPGA